jgi:hypothetical protein
VTEVWFQFHQARGAPIVLPHDVYEWLEESGAEWSILYAWWPRGSDQACAILGFEAFEDAMLFKLRWLSVIGAGG